jgi:hypothetical protein
VEGVDSATVRGELLAYPAPLAYRWDGDRVVLGRPRPAPRPGGDLLITTGKSYNRVEGLPITFGPRVQTAGSNPLRVHALAVYRTESGLTLDTERMGYYVRAEQFLGGHRALRIGATAHSLVEPIEEWHLSDLENALATFAFHRDYRDHFERTGLGAFARWDPEDGPASLSLEGRWERHDRVSVGSPWTLTDNAEPWRPQPLVAVGRLGSVALQGTFDTRSHALDPSTGWHVRGRVEQALHSSLRLPAAYTGIPALGLVPLEREEFGRFTTGLLDVRRYNRVNAGSRLNLRFLAGGSLDGSVLPPQRQHALGGEGSLPGYDLFQLDCGARSAAAYLVPGGGAPFVPRYGCDAFALLQAEFRGKLDFRLRLDAAPWEDAPEGGLGWGWDMAPDWTVFVDAGRAWAFDQRPDERLRVDVGTGLLVDRFGIFLAKALSGGDGINLFVRLGPRF